jgi:FkbM family methyltransferase
MFEDCQDAVSLIAALEQRFPSYSINWEGILAHQYAHCLDRPAQVVDIGANEGAHVAQMLLLHPRRVVCFEPIPELAAQLRLKFTQNPVVVHQCALSNAKGRRTFYFNHDVPPESGLELRKDSDVSHRIEQIEVEVARLDDFDLQDVAFIKLDCEGAELDALDGAAETIRRSAPLISVEYGAAGYRAYGRAKSDLLKWALAHGYAPADLFGRSLARNDTFDACVDRYYWDFFLIPVARTASIEQSLRAGATAIFGNFDAFRAGKTSS